ncbi:Hypothetical predicted protein [Cloeon dipterum]|uniref:Bee-milk protein n=1 Tax=Cloeon dipterum TaxID=197152 RepID=A0A8S1DBL8_9INSE|nr:Hypothetical predicted protein [Cloeon dipterum]
MASECGKQKANIFGSQSVKISSQFLPSEQITNVKIMDPLFFVIVLFHLSLATAVKFTQVFEWPDVMDYEWPSEASRTNALNDRTFNPNLEEYSNIPVSLVSFPTSSESPAPPKLTPFPSWDMHGKRDCNKIGLARGLEVDSVGRLWILETGSIFCNAKLWIFDLSNNNQTNLMYPFPFLFRMHDLVLDETPNGTLAFISHMGLEQIVVFSLETKQSWIVKTPGIEVLSIALSPRKEPTRQLYVSYWNSYELYSISVTKLRNGDETANPEQIGKWTGRPYRMLMDNHGSMYAAFWQENCILSWNTSQPFKKQHFYEVGKLNNYKPFTFALDSSGTFWLTEHNKSATKPRLRLLKAAVGAKPYNFEDPTFTKASPTTTTISPKTEPTHVNLSIVTATTTTPESTPVTATTATQIHETTEIVQKSNASSTKLPELNHDTPVSLSIIATTTISSPPAEENSKTEDRR